MKKWVVFIFIALFLQHGWAQQEERVKVISFLKSESYQNAVQRLLKIEDAGLGDFETKLQLAQSYYALRDFSSALEWIEKARKINDLGANYHLLYAKLLKSNGQKSQADEILKQLGKEYEYLLSSPIENIPVSSFNVFPIPNFNTEGDDFSPVYYRDGIIYVSNSPKKKHLDNRNQRSYLSIFHLPYKPTGLEKGNATELKIPKINAYHKGPVAITRSDNLMYFSNNQNVSKKSKVSTLGIFSLKRRYGKWTELTPFPYNSPNYSISHPTLSESGDEMYFVSDMPGGYGGTDIYYTKFSRGKWSAPVNLGSVINTSQNEMFPFLHKDGTLYFASEGHPGYGGLDIFYSRKEGDEWMKPVNMGQPINSGYDDFGLILDKQLKYGFLSSNRPGGKGNDDVYRVESIYANKDAYRLIAGIVSDKQTQEIIEGANVSIYADGKLLQEVTSNAEGKFEVGVNAQFEKVYILTTYGSYFPHEREVEVKKVNNIPQQDIALERIEINKSIVVPNIYYDLDKADITDAAQKNLDKLYQLLVQNPSWIIEIAAHTDSRAETAYNQKLSDERAKNVVKYLQQKGITASRLYSKGFGEKYLINHCKDGVECTEEEHAVNRRTEFKLIGFEHQLANNTTVPIIFADEYVAKSDLKYKIQIGVFAQPDAKWLQQLSDLGNIEIEDVEKSDLKRIYLSSYPNLESAQSFLNIVHQRGLKDAIIMVSWKGKTMTQEAYKKLKKK